MVQISHILVCIQPGHSVDLSYVNMLKSLDSLRNKVYNMYIYLFNMCTLYSPINMI